MTKRTCSVRGCDREYLARGWCNAHYHRWKATGDVEADRPVREVIPDPVERFWSKVDRGDGGADDCWLWTGVKSHDGYGITTHDSTRTYAHRFAWELLVGPIPEGMTLDHLCRVRGCVRAPEHLSVVTIQENMRRGMGLAAVNARKTHCKYGHPFDEQNTWVGRKGQRKCRTCMRLAKRKARRRAGRAGR